MKLLVAKENEVHLWYLRLEQNLNLQVTAQYLKELSSEEREKYGNIMVQWKKSEYLQARSFMRDVLSKYDLSVKFSLSHCKGLMVCAVALKNDVGVDVEYVRDSGDLLDVAQNNFSFDEFQEIKDLPQILQVPKFYEYWTLREAYLKARGVGLSLPLQSISFFHHKNDSIQFSIDDEIDNSPKEWQFSLVRPTSEHQLALAVRQKEDSPVCVVENWVHFTDK